MQKLLIEIQGAVARVPELRFTQPVNLSFYTDQHWAVIGPNGAGKSLLSDLITGKVALKEGTITYHSDNKDESIFKQIKSVAFQDVYSMADYKQMYYQQRWNSMGVDETPFVKDLVKSIADESDIHSLFALFGIEELLEKRIILLSSGELRKFLIVKTLLTKPRMLILDNPYIGLDAPSRGLLNELLEQMATHHELQIVLILSNPDDIPSFITHTLPVQDKTIGEPLERGYFMENEELINQLFPQKIIDMDFPGQSGESLNADYETTLEMFDIHIRYGNRTILQNLNWKILKGENWALLGPNGAGKSTLLSLVCADNPQSYANTFYLFDKKRGSGESIWDIKKRIGYISPEIHLYYQTTQTALEIVGSGFFDSIGLYRKCNEEQLKNALEWMRIFHIEPLKDIPFLKLSYGEQRLVMLARSFVKNPQLLILDEPLHGLDKSNKALASGIIEQFCNQPDKTLIYVTHYLHEIPKCVDQRFTISRNNS